jgi:quercetin dioxygenase-like cupin family protein
MTHKETSVLIRTVNHTLTNIEDDVDLAGVTRDQGWKGIRIRFFEGEASGSENCCMFRAHFPPGAAHERHFHPNADEFFYLISGRAAVGAEDEEHVATPGTVQFVPAGKVHWLRNLDRVEPVEVVGIYVGGRTLTEAGYEYVGEIAPEHMKASAHETEGEQLWTQ